MDMERITKRSFDRPRELPGLKKPRLTEEQPPLNPNGRPLTHRPAPSPPLPATRYRGGGDRGGDSEGNESRYQPQAQPYQELVNQYKTALAELTFNSKPIITNLTIIAGENQHAAKAIATTVCANILEVPSEQKLPSLYLLDSIVKNIGSDYIKYFSARLPEVFCKAYRQVDPSVHASLRHLYGTWKGVFPPQTLQMIDKELGFSSALNGGSPKDVTSRPDSQSQNPPRSIHVNPKYLERQRLQQSSRAKEIANDMNVPTTNSTEDVERMDRTTVIGAGWVDPPIKIRSIQRPHREAISEPVYEKKIGAVYGDFKYGSDISRKSALAVGKTTGRISEQGLEKPWHSTGASVADAISGQRNGLNIKHGFLNFSAAKSAGVDLQLRPTHSIATRSSDGMSTSWKNSEEEEFIWEMHSRISDQDAVNLSNNSREDHWTPDDSDKLEFESNLRKPKTVHELGSIFDREAPSDSLSMEQKEQTTFGRHLPSPGQESQLTDDLVFSGTFVSKGHSEGYSTTIGGLPKSANSSGRMSVRATTASPPIVSSGFGFSTNASLGSMGTVGQQRFQSIGAALPSGQSPMQQHPPSPSDSAGHSHQQLRSSADQDRLQSLSLLQRNHKAPQILGSLPSSALELGNLQKLRTEDLQASSSKMLALQQNRQRPVLQPQQDSIKSESSGGTKKQHLSPVRTPSTLGSSASDNSDILPAESPGQLSTSNLLAAVVKSGILSNITSVGLAKQSFQDNEQSSIHLPLPSGPLPPQSTTSVPNVKSSLSMYLSPDNASAASNFSQMKQEHPPLPPAPPPSSAQSNAVKKTPDPISNLLSSLVSKGLISASASASSKSETSSTLQPQVPSQSEKEKPSDTTPSSSPIPSSPVSSSIPQSAAGNEALNSESDSKTSVALPQSKIVEIENLIGLEFKPEVIRGLHSPVIRALFDGITHQCCVCGLRLKLKEQHDRHLEWHEWKKQELAVSDGMTRRWYVDAENWIAGMAGLFVGVETSGFVDELGRITDKDEQMVPANEDQCACVLCGELFEDYYSQQNKKWMFKGAVHVAFPPGDGYIGTTNESASGLIVHVSCMSESLFDDLGLTTGIKMENVHDV